MGAFDLIKELRGAGVSVRSDGGVLDISPADRLTDEMIEALKRNKPEILALLKKEDARPDRQEWKPGRCDRCIHLSRFVGGNACRTDNGLPWLFGLLYTVPDDRGAVCASWMTDKWEKMRPTDWQQG